MNYQAILLVTSSVVLGAVMFSAIGASAQDANIDAAGREMGRRGHQRFFRGVEPGAKQVVAEVLRLSRSEIASELKSGKTIEDIASEQGYEDIESFKAEVEKTVREKLAEKGLNEDQIDTIIERRKHRIEHRPERLSENFDEEVFNERMQKRGLSEEEIDSRLERTLERIDSFISN